MQEGDGGPSSALVQVPGGVGVEGGVGGVTRKQLVVALSGDHGGVVAAEVEGGEVEL